MRCVPAPLAIIAVTIVLAASATTANAGKLSRARGNVRGNAPAAKRETPADDSSAGKLASTRKSVRQEDRREQDSAGEPDRVARRDRHSGRGRRGGSYLRPPRRSHGGGSFGFFAFDRCEPCCPPPVVCAPPVEIIETHVYHQPVVPIHTAPPAYVPPPAPEPVYPSPVEQYFRQFARYPYADGCEGYMYSSDSRVGKDWAGRVQFEFGSDFDGVDRTGGAFLIETVSGWGADFAWNSYREDVPGGGYDELHIGDANLLYRIAETDHSLVRVGVGAAWLGDAYDTDFGVNFTLRGDFMPADPVVLSGELDLGTLGDAQHVHAAGTVGVMLGRAEVYGGYDYRRIGDVEIEGPMLGLRVWF